MPAALELLPDEIVQLIVARLSTPDLKSVAGTCRTLHRHATDLLWRHVCLMDQWQLHLNEQTRHLWGDRGHGECDEHDDSRIIQKLYVLATNPELAAKVQVLTHRCHLPTPNIFTDLPRMHFHGPTLSQDERLQSLLRLAIRNMVKLHTLRIIYGHMHLSSALVAGFLDPARPRHGPLRKLWLESCCLSEDTLSFLLPSKTTNLESIRLRRLEFASLTALRTRHMGRFEFCLARGSQYYQLLNGAGGWVGTTVHWSEQGLPERWPRPSSAELRHKAELFDAAIWQRFPAIREYIEHERPLPSARPLLPVDRNPFCALLEFSASTLTSLNLDWLLWRRSDSDSHDESKSVLALLANMRYPHLRAFQIRNAILPQTKLPEDVFLLQGDLLDFMEAHPKIQCLGWPIDKFYSHYRSSVHVQSRVRKLIAHLADMITDLRIDTQFTGHGEPLTDAGQTLQETHERVRRRRFIAEFVPQMRKIQHVKLEGGLPRDEKREILRGLHHCNLKKIVMIGTSFPPGNTWGAQGVQLKALDPGLGSDTVYNLEDEDLPGILESYRRGFPILTNFQFEPEYGWSNQAPLLQVIALHHARTVEELKICGYNGCPLLSCQTAITDPLLNGIRHFHNLKQLVISFWLLTWYEDSYRDTEIIQSWVDRRSSSSTALITITPPQSAGQELPVDPGHFPNFSATRPPPRRDFNRWAVTLKTRFSPSALAYRLAQDIGPYLSPEAKNQPGGVRVRGSFCLGAREERRAANDIFDMDIRIGRNDQVLEFMGPREEAESSRWWQKLENRQWF